MTVLLVLYLKYHGKDQSQGDFPLFSSNSFMVSGFKSLWIYEFKSLIYFKLIFVRDVRWGSNFILLHMDLPYDPAIPLLGIHPKETKSISCIYTPMSIAVLLTIAKLWK